MIFLLILVWNLCGLYAFGSIMADFNWRNKNEWPLLNRSSKDNLGICLLVFFTGPMGAFASALSTNFNQHGWELWQSKKQ